MILSWNVGELTQPQTEVHSRNGFEGESNLFKYSNIPENINQAAPPPLQYFHADSKFVFQGQSEGPGGGERE